MTEVKLSRLEARLERLDYPVTREAAAERLADTTLLLADGEADLAAVVGDAGAPDDRFESAADLRDEVYGALPTAAVGEPGQSEGEG